MKLKGCRFVWEPDSVRLECLSDLHFYRNQLDTFISLLTLASKYKTYPDEVNYKNSFFYYKVETQSDYFRRFEDFYPDLFRTKKDINIEIPENVFIPNENKKQFESYDFNSYSQIVDTYFLPSHLISSRKETLLSKYFKNIKLENTICVSYYKDPIHGAPSFENYKNELNNLLDRTNLKYIFLQTDDSEAVKFFKREYGKKVIFLSETIVKEKKKKQFCFWYEASLRVASECGYVISGTNNVSMWLNLYRGSTENVFQFNEELNETN